MRRRCVGDDGADGGEKAAAALGRANQALTRALQRAHSNMQIGRQPAEHVRVDKVQVA